MGFAGDAFQNDGFQVSAGGETPVVGGFPPGVFGQVYVVTAVATASLPGGTAADGIPSGSATDPIPSGS